MAVEEPDIEQTEETDLFELMAEAIRGLDGRVLGFDERLNAIENEAIIRDALKDDTKIDRLVRELREEIARPIDFVAQDLVEILPVGDKMYSVSFNRQEEFRATIYYDSDQDDYVVQIQADSTWTHNGTRFTVADARGGSASPNTLEWYFADVEDDTLFVAPDDAPNAAANFLVGDKTDLDDEGVPAENRILVCDVSTANDADGDAYPIVAQAQLHPIVTMDGQNLDGDYSEDPDMNSLETNPNSSLSQIWGWHDPESGNTLVTAMDDNDVAGGSGEAVHYILLRQGADSGSSEVDADAGYISYADFLAGLGDDKSIHATSGVTDPENLQIFGYDSASTAAPLAADLFPYKDAVDDQINWSTIDSMSTLISTELVDADGPWVLGVPVSHHGLSQWQAVTSESYKGGQAEFDDHGGANRRDGVTDLGTADYMLMLLGAPNSSTKQEMYDRNATVAAGPTDVDNYLGHDLFIEDILNVDTIMTEGGAGSPDERIDVLAGQLVDGGDETMVDWITTADRVDIGENSASKYKDLFGFAGLKLAQGTDLIEFGGPIFATTATDGNVLGYLADGTYILKMLDDTANIGWQIADSGTSFVNILQSGTAGIRVGDGTITIDILDATYGLEIGGAVGTTGSINVSGDYYNLGNQGATYTAKRLLIGDEDGDPHYFKIYGGIYVDA